jgi:predicted helicase
MYFMVPKDFELKKEYEEGFSVAELFVVNGVGITTAHDEFVIHEKEEDLLKFYQDFQASERNENLLHQKFNVKKKLGWSILNGYDNIKNETDLKKFIKPISYRPFDNRYIFYETKLVWRTVEKVMQNFLAGENLGLITARSNKSDTCDHFYITKNISETKCGERTTQSAVFPLYLYNQQPESADLLNHSKPARVPNLNPKIIKEISTKLDLKFVPDHKLGAITLPLREGQTSEASLGRGQNSNILKELNFASNSQPLLGSLRSPILPQGEDDGIENCFSPLDVLDYIYAVLHSPSYREKYQEFLKIDFPRVPYPQDQNSFWQLVKLGGELRKIHLLEGEIFEKLITKYPADGDNKVEKISYESEKVKINQSQYFQGVAPNVWEFFIGGYQPAQKWLKDRKDKILSFEEILHYQKIIVALSETDLLMKEIDKINLTSF